MAVSLQARTLPALAGWSWISGGFALFRRNPPLMTSLTLSYLLVMVFLNVVPLLGPVLVAICLPLMSVIVFNGSRLLDERRDVSAEALKQGLAPNARTLVQLGFVHLGGCLRCDLMPHEFLQSMRCVNEQDWKGCSCDRSFRDDGRLRSCGRLAGGARLQGPVLRLPPSITGRDST